ncbi:hypothetical protein HPP92_012643 [Vanilla planifolia]|uniref:Myb-like domain-containing protein n=1 Tax=Vanilla planifolia TaxID=51239 RepID=A0A835QW07_VANPL|nr:hypothetical protein HPP92_012643 [Vanilla planifolia]
MQQNAGGSQYGIPSVEMPSQFSSPGAGQLRPFFLRISGGGGTDYAQQQHHHHHQSTLQPITEAASPVSCRPAPTRQEFILDSVSMNSSFPDEVLGDGEEGERAGVSGNRWPRQETLALLKIRSEMEDNFRSATIKGHLWEDVSRKLGDLGYKRSSKKCREKFENVQKYYKRTKEARAGRQDGKKSYRFFNQLEALYNSSNSTAAVSSLPFSTNTTSLLTISSSASPNSTSSAAAPRNATNAPPSARIQPPALPTVAPSPVCVPAESRSALELATSAAAGISFSSNTSLSFTGSDGDNEEDDAVPADCHLRDGSRKRKRKGSPWGRRKMMTFFGGLMKQMLERQEEMQQRFLDTVEMREQDRMVREEAWKRQEMVRLNREYEAMAQERTMAANRDAAVISILQKFSKCTANQTRSTAVVSATASDQPQPSTVGEPHPTPPQKEKRKPPPPARKHHLSIHGKELQQEINKGYGSDVVVLHQSLASSQALPIASVSETSKAVVGSSIHMVSPSTSLSRWPKSEVLALIKLRCGLDMRYLETGPKGPLWEEISLGMKQHGYNRSAKRCKEKWENINKYFKKVKESNKKRPEDAKTCPYFHELDTLYRKKQLSGGSNSIITMHNQQQHNNPNANLTHLVQVSTFSESISGQIEKENSSRKENPTIIRDCENNECFGVPLAPKSSVGGLQQLFVNAAPKSGNNGFTTKERKDTLNEIFELQDQPHHVVDNYDKFVQAADSETLNHEEDIEDEDYDEDEEGKDGNLRYEIQFQRQSVRAAGRAPETTTPTPGSFLAVQ